MKWLSFIVIGAALAVISSASLAFDEQKIAPAAKGSGGGAGAASSKPADGGLGITAPELSAPKSDTGTKIRVPGLGVIGEIPRMDFGLELLYGAQNSKQTDLDRADPNGVMVRGTLPLNTR